MKLFDVAVVLVLVKTPILCFSWYLYRVIKDVPAPEIENDGGDFLKAEFDQGPRNRGPHGGPGVLKAAARRGAVHPAPQTADARKQRVAVDE